MSEGNSRNPEAAFIAVIQRKSPRADTLKPLQHFIVLTAFQRIESLSAIQSAMRRDKEAIKPPMHREDLVQFGSTALGPTVRVECMTENGSPAWLRRGKNLPVLALVLTVTRETRAGRERFGRSAYHSRRGESPPPDAGALPCSSQRCLELVIRSGTSSTESNPDEPAVLLQQLGNRLCSASGSTTTRKLT